MSKSEKVARELAESMGAEYGGQNESMEDTAIDVFPKEEVKASDPIETPHIIVFDNCIVQIQGELSEDQMDVMEDVAKKHGFHAEYR